MSKEGFLLIDKPAGITSHDVVDQLRRITGIRKIGHAGTLDPFATGLLVVGVGRSATKRLGELVGADKIYEAVMVLGATSDTQDKTGKITTKPDPLLPEDSAAIQGAMDLLIGETEQVPPMYSAKKVKGRKLYELARAGQEVEREPVKITVHELEVTEYEPPRVSFRVRCSSGTYVRTLAHDLGQTLSTGAYLESLHRHAVGQFQVENAQRAEELTPENWERKLVSLP